MRKVNLFFVGAGKCGTTWLYGLAKAHDKISVSKIKETLFFEQETLSEISKYHDFFVFNSSSKYIAEFSNTYIFNPTVPERLYKYNPNSKIVFTVRNPIDRAISHYQFLLRGGRKLPPFEKAIYDSHTKHILERGLYYSHIKKYLNYFDKKSIIILFLEDLSSDKEIYVKKLGEFLSLDFLPISFDESKYKLPASKPRVRILARLFKHGANLARQCGGGSIIQYFKESPIQRLVYRKLDDSDKIQIDKSMYSELVDYYKNDVEELSNLTSRDLNTFWFSKNPQ